MFKGLLNNLFTRQERDFRVEDFGRVRENQSYAMNKHLQDGIALFDAEYAKTYKLGTEHHSAFRELFARSFSKAMLDSHRSNPGDIAELRSKTSTRIAGGPEITVKIATTFDGSRASLDRPWSPNNHGHASEKLDRA